VKLLRFAFPGLCLIGVAACAYATARLIGWVPPGKLAPYPDWTVSHFVSATVFALLVPFQFWSTLRSRRPALHRAFGRAAIVAGAVMAASGLAMAYLSPDRPVAERIFMTTFFLAYAASLGLGLRAALGRRLDVHRTWMVRMTATALTPVTQRLVFPVLAGALGVDGLETFWQIFTSAAWLAWLINLTVAEAWLQNGRPARRLAPVNRPA
jgi:hypothetical protein